MSIITDAKGNVFESFHVVAESALETMTLESPLTHALTVVRQGDKVLLLFNKWRRNWELPGGLIEQGETARDCIMRELQEETNQSAANVVFKGLMKFDLQPSFHGPQWTEYGALFAGELMDWREFEANDEAEQVMLWCRESDIGPIAEIERKLIEFA
ncbi:8-oxo-dGTP diphosphatase [Paenibacillus phyllosphaerae]|uniref:8-oxo-dGTP diphosphatase n=1 Tax=Paenibacillus phyllosphaerae TaxID=274593 RepID=A0A7W5FML1_9BACL|nr:NUDIX domain-containing protein [Paenibacillus phyllosphaerae]MBB3110187.1 8-oxo-dGTP diphosphatase [Paenibacillus phyllosphaerae]